MQEPAHEHALHGLIHEAQQEIARLRGEVYSAARLADERSQALDAMTAARDSLASVAQQLEAKVAAMHSQVMELPQLTQQLHSLQHAQQHAEHDRALQLQARRILESELQDERAARAAAEEARAKAAADRARLQLARDDLTAQLRLLQAKVADAEEEQLRAEEEAQQLRQELAAAGPPPQQQQQRQQEGALRGSSSAACDGRACSWRLELDAATARNASLEQAVQQARAEAQRATTEVSQLQQQLASTRQQPQHEHSPLQQQGRATAQAAATAPEVPGARPPGADDLPAAAGGGGLGGVRAPSGASEAETLLQEQVELLMGKLVSLKKSRDRLLEQLDGQSMELDQVLADNQTIQQQAAAHQQEGRRWLAQAADALAAVSRLQEMLQEGRGPGDDADAAATQEQQRQCELQVRVLAAQLLRSHAAATGVAASVGPLLGGVEARLLALKARAHRAAAAAEAAAAREA